MRQMRRSNEDYREIRRYLSAVLKLRYHETFICSILRDVFFLYLFETTSKVRGERMSEESNGEENAVEK